MTASPDRARLLLARPGAWLEADGAGYALRLGADRRSRVVTTLDETVFLALVARPGLRPRQGGGWRLRPEADSPPDLAGRPGVLEGERTIMDADGRPGSHRANLGESPLAWLARRRDADGRPFLTAAQLAAGERLRADAEEALSGPSLTMRWDALPRSGSGTSARVEPTDRALSAARRVEAALTAAGPRLRPMLDRICVRSSSLRLAEEGLGLKRREGKTMLREGLDALARHYRIG